MRTWSTVLLAGLLAGCASSIPKGHFEWNPSAAVSPVPDGNLAKRNCNERLGAGPDTRSVPSSLVVRQEMHRLERVWFTRYKDCMYRQGWVFVPTP